MKCQVWIGGSWCFDCEAQNEEDARQQARDWLEVKRLPRGTTVCKITSGYYQEIVRLNQEAGFDASNL